MFNNKSLLSLGGAALIAGSYFLFKNNRQNLPSNETGKKIDELKSTLVEEKQNITAVPLLSERERIKNLHIVKLISTISKSIWPCMCLKKEYCDSPYIEMQHTILKFIDGKAYWKDNSGPLYSTPAYVDPDRSELLSAYGTIAILESGEVLASPYFVKHCRLTHEKPTIFAGEYMAKNGVITYLNRRSGHYQTDKKSLDIAMKVFELNDLEIENIKIDPEENYR